MIIGMYVLLMNRGVSMKNKLEDVKINTKMKKKSIDEKCEGKVKSEYTCLDLHYLKNV